MNTSAPWPDRETAEARVLAMQCKLHRWATSDAGRCFDDLFNLVHDPAFLVVAWHKPAPIAEQLRYPTEMVEKKEA